MSAVAPVPGTVAAGTRAGRVAFRPVARPVAFGGRARPPPTVRPRATDDDDAVELVFVRPSDADPEDVVEVRCAARVGENLLDFVGMNGVWIDIMHMLFRISERLLGVLISRHSMTV